VNLQSSREDEARHGAKHRDERYNRRERLRHAFIVMTSGPICTLARRLPRGLPPEEKTRTRRL